MSSTGTLPVYNEMYSKLVDDEVSFESFNPRADIGHPASPVRAFPMPRGSKPYRLATICLTALCVILLISIIAVAAHYKNKPESGSEAELQKQKEDANVLSLITSINKLQQEKKLLQKERDELLTKIASTTAMSPTSCASSAPMEIKPTMIPAPIVCPADWHLFNNSCYFISRIMKDWPESQSYCLSQGGYLAIIHTAEEQTFLWNLLPRGHWNAFWFGITDKHTEDQWKWVDGTPLVAGFWEVGEPNNHIDEDCGYIVKTRVLERLAIRSWYDAPCTMFCRFICEKEMGANASIAMPHQHVNIRSRGS